MSGLIEREVQRFMNVANANGIQYHIVMPDGEEYGGIKAKRTRAPSQYPHGTFVGIFRERCADMDPGELRAIDAGDIDLEKLRSGLTAAACSAWGVDTHTSSVNRENNTVELLRTA